MLAASKYAQAADVAGWFFAMPTRGTADGLHDRLERILPDLTTPAGQASPPSLQRVHAMARLHPISDHAGDAGRVWLSGSRKAVLAPFGVGTVDQMLMGAARLKHSPVRMLGAATGCLIIDEAHSYDWYMAELLKRLLGWMGSLGAPVVVMSATLPQTAIEELWKAYRDGTLSHISRQDRPEPEQTPRCAYPGWLQWTPTNDGAGVWLEGSARPQRPGWRLAVTVHETAAADTTAAVAAEAAAAVAEGGCVLVVRETITAAQQTYDAITAAAPGCETVLAHSRFRNRDRRRIESSLTQRLGPPDTAADRPEKLIVVATQIVEMSLDVDFDYTISDPAPIGALIQRAGRSHRHTGRSRPPTHHQPRLSVFWPTRNNNPQFRSPVYMEHDLRRCRELLDEHTTIAVPEDVPRLVDLAALSDPVGDAGEEAWIEWIATADVQRGAARTKIIPDPSRLASRCLTDLTSTDDDDHVAPTPPRRPHRAGAARLRDPRRRAQRIPGRPPAAGTAHPPTGARTSRRLRVRRCLPAVPQMA